MSPGTQGRAVWRGWPLPVVIALGILTGVGSFTFAYGQGTAYFSQRPEACANCHVMWGHYESWRHSSHQHVAVCNDCHLPPGFLGKWLTKGDNGFFHSLAFTTGAFPDPIRIKRRNASRTQRACLACHAELLHPIAANDPDDAATRCARCHAGVGHAQR